MMGSNFAVQGLRFLTVALLARRLGTESFGIYNYLILLLGFGAIGVEFGLKNFGMREIAQGRGSKQLVQKIVLVRLLLAVVASLVVGTLAHHSFPLPSHIPVLAFFAATLFVDAALLDFVLMAQEKLGALAFGNVAQALVFYGGVFFFVSSSESLLYVAQAYLVSHLIWVAIYFFSAKRLPETPSPAKPLHLRGVAVQGLPILAAYLLGNLQYSMDLLLLGQFHFSEWLGVYSAGLKILGLPLGIINSLMAAIQPRLARESHDLRSDKLTVLVHHSTRLVWVLIVPAILGCWLFGGSVCILRG
jgi:O-antigen/teichoic acid export membrane protein